MIEKIEIKQVSGKIINDLDNLKVIVKKLAKALDEAQEFLDDRERYVSHVYDVWWNCSDRYGQVTQSMKELTDVICRPYPDIKSWKLK